MEIGQKIKQERLRAGITQKELAKRADITARTVSGLESGSWETAKPITIKRIEKALNLPNGYLSGEYKKKEGAVLLGNAGDEPQALLDANLIIENAKVFFAGGSLSDETKQKFMEALLQSYLECKK